MKKKNFTWNWLTVLFLSTLSAFCVSCSKDSDISSNTEEVYVPKDGEEVITNEDLGYDYMGRYVFINGGKELKLEKAGIYFSYIPEYIEYKGKEYPVTIIGERACGSYSLAYENQGFYSIKIPQHVKIIEKGAFMGCHASKASIPNSVEVIGENAFERCRELGEVNISDGISIIEPHTFWYCENLVSISIPKNVKKIKEYAFAYCSSLRLITIGSNVTNIGDHAFYFSNSKGRLVEITSLNEEPTNIAENAFSTDLYNKATLYVPAGTIEKYKACTGWKNFVNIKEKTQQSQIM